MTNFSCGSLEVQCSCTDFDLDTAPKAKKAENEATLDPFPCLSEPWQLCTWGHLAQSEAEALGPLIDSVNDSMERGKQKQ